MTIAGKGLMNKLGLLMQVCYVTTIDKTRVGKLNKELLREKHLN